VNLKLKSNAILLLIFGLLLTPNILASDFTTKEKLAFKSEFKWFLESALHKGTDNTENIPLYDRHWDYFYSGVEVAVVGNYNGNARNEIFRDKIEAGGYFRGSFGAEFPVAKQLVFSTAIGFLYDEITGDLTDGSGGKGYAGFTTTQVDFIGFYNFGQHRIGLGGAFHYNPKFNYKEVGSNFQMHGVYRFSNALGATIQYDFLASNNISLGIRYTDISYDFDTVNIGDYVAGEGNNEIYNCLASCDNLIDASSFSGHITYRF